MSDLNEMVRLFDEADDSAAFDGDHPILRLAIERDGLLERGKAQQSTIDSLRQLTEEAAEYRRENAALREAKKLDAAELGRLRKALVSVKHASHTHMAVEIAEHALAQSNDTPDEHAEGADCWCRATTEGRDGVVHYNRDGSVSHRVLAQQDTPDAEGKEQDNGN